MVTELMMPITLENQAVTRLGLKAMRTVWPTSAGAGLVLPGQEFGDLVGENLLGVARADSRLHRSPWRRH